ncbi:Arylsulfatase precursor [Caulifigura coniformis]|uniref:Arylsulfatase n=1 Tax=Caulifigura coniformis TaxID=2527983 RepID=A0A517SDN5_9PLAN|nr:sulfatase-like hydrolase/transferase [Caulifigura coniformis]QDT54238.1 Arylsulfatase precursor [Caulifigura coniformis]
MTRLCLLAFCLSLAASASAAEKPNILFLVGDDMGYADVGFHGCKDIPTPNLDALARSSVRFTNGYVSGPYCSPTRAGLLTGRYQTRFGHEFNPGGDGDGGALGLPVSETLIPARLKSAGYATALTGKWHLGSAEQFHPQRRGFDDFFGFLGGAHDYFNERGILRGNEPAGTGEYLTDVIGREAVKFMESKKGSPWFLYVAFNAVHTPMQADDARLRKFESITDPQRRKYAAMMFAMDEAIGKILKAVEESGQAQNTLVAFISDNGGPTMNGVTVNGSINTPFRGSKRTTLEGGIHVPFLLRWPSQFQAGVYEQPVIQLDLTATALAAAGVDPSSAKLDGVDLRPHLSGSVKKPPHDALYWRFGQQMAIRNGNLKLVRYDSNADTNTGKGGQPVTEAKLYDLEADAGESKDLAAAMPEKVKELQAKWDRWNEGNVEPLWGSSRGGGRGQRRQQRQEATK